MSTTKLTTDLNIHQSKPNKIKGQAATTKAYMDKPVNDVKDYLNNTLTVEIDTLDAANVKKTGNQSIDGVKTFTSSPIVPVASADSEVPQKKYIDDKDTAQTGALNTHKSGSDHDGRYYTETELDGGQLDNRYFTETELSKTTATSGAELIGSKTISGVTGSTVWAQISNLYTQLVNVVLGQILDRSLTYIKIALNTITEAEMANDMKKQAGGVAPYDDVIRKDLLTTQGDIIYASAANTPARLPKGSAFQKLKMNSGATAPEWVDDSVIGCKIYRTTAQSINSGTFTVVNFDNEETDTNTMHDNVTNNSRIVIPKTGPYLIIANFAWTFNATGTRLAYINRNGSLAGVDVIAYDSKPSVTTGSDRSGVYLTAIKQLTLNDYLELYVRQDSGGALNIDVGILYPHFEVYYLGK